MSKKKIYWANVCILNRKESELMEKASETWNGETGNAYEMIYLGDTEEVKIHQKLEEDIDSGKLGFHLLVSTRFDLFCSGRYLLGRKDNLLPIGEILPIREEIKRAGVEDPFHLYYPLAILPHFIVCNSEVQGSEPAPSSLEELLDSRWEGKVFIGNTELPSGQAVLFAMWYLFGDEGLETCVRNWRQKSAPSAVRHGLIKGEFPIGILPGVFSGPGPKDRIFAVRPKEGMPVLPSYAAAVRSGNFDHQDDEDTMNFLKASAASQEYHEFYKDMAHAVVSDPSVPLPANAEEGDKYIFPPWEWILKKDLDYFLTTIKQIPLI